MSLNNDSNYRKQSGRKGGKQVVWVDCPLCEQYGYFQFNIHTRYYCTTNPCTMFEYRSSHERRAINQFGEYKDQT